MKKFLSICLRIYLLIAICGCQSQFQAGETDNASEKNADTSEAVAYNQSGAAAEIQLGSKIVVQFNKSLERNIYGRISFETPPVEFINKLNCSMVFSASVHENDTITVMPFNDFNYGESAGITISGFKDRAGNPMTLYSAAEDGFSVFESGDRKPGIISIAPGNNSADVMAGSNIVIQFAAGMKTPKRGPKGSVSFKEPSISFINGNNCEMTFSTAIYKNDTLTIEPYEDLDPGIYRNITIAGFRTASGKKLPSYIDEGYNFTVVDGGPPGVVRIEPLNGASNVPTNVGGIRIVFNESLKDDACGFISFEQPPLTFTNGANCSMAFSSHKKKSDTVIIKPYSLLDVGTYSDITISGFKDLAGNSMKTYTDKTYHFIIVQEDVINWNKRITGFFGEPYAIITVGNRIIAAGYGSVEIAKPSNYTGDDWLIKIYYDDSGKLYRTLYMGGDYQDRALAAIPSESNIYVAGYEEYDFNGYGYLKWGLKKINPFSGEMFNNWNKSSSEDGSTSVANGVAVDSRGNVYVAGYGWELIGAGTKYDWWIKKFDKDGNEDTAWDKRFDGKGSNDYTSGIAIDKNDNVYIVGYGSNLTGSESGNDWWIKKLDHNGNEAWDKKFDGNGGDDCAYFAAIDGNNNLYVAGSGTNLADADTRADFWIKKFDSNGNEDSALWNKKIDRNKTIDIAFSVAVDANNDVYIVGRTGDRSWLKKYYSNGVEDTVNWNKVYDFEQSDSNSASGVAVNARGNIYVIGYINCIDKSVDWWIKKFYPTR